MRWRRHRKTDPTDPTPELIEAQKALEKSDRDLVDTRERNYEIVVEVTKAKRLAEANNFTEMIRAALQAQGK